MKWEGEIFQLAIIGWILEKVPEREYAPFSRAVGFDHDGRTFRKLRSGQREWHLEDICMLASHWGSSPSHLLAEIEIYYIQHEKELLAKLAQKQEQIKE